MINPYKLLGVSADASDEQITAVYRALAKAYHPDKNSDQASHTRFRQITAAYEILSDPVRRRAYDRSTKRSNSTGKDQSKDGRPERKYTNTNQGHSQHSRPVAPPIFPRGAKPLIFTLATVAAILLYFDNDKAARSVEPRVQTDATVAAREENTSRNTIDPSRVTVVLDAMEEKRVPTCDFLPRSGDGLRGTLPSEEYGHTITIDNSTSENAIVNLRNSSSGVLYFQFFVRKREKTSIENIQDGTYRIQFAKGEKLERTCREFLNPTFSEFKGDQTLALERVGNRLRNSILTITLHTVPGGNLRKQVISAAEFSD